MDTESPAQVERIIKSATPDLRQDMTDLRQSTETTAAALRQDMADIKRHTDVSFEELRHDIQMLAEGLQLHLDRRHTEKREYMEREFREMRALIKLS